MQVIEQGHLASSIEALFDRRFHVRRSGSTLRTELLAGLTTFFVMSYIIFLNPLILATPGAEGSGIAGLEISATTTVTCLVAGVMSIIMGLYANKAYALAPGLGLNAVVAFSLVGQEGLTYPQAMGVVVAEGIVITVLVLAGVRKYVMDIVPLELKKGISVGIGLFILFIGLVNGGLVRQGTGTPVEIGTLRGAPVLVTAVGLLITLALLARGFRAAILLGIVATTVFAIVLEEALQTGQFPDGQAQVPSSLVSTPDFSLVGAFSFGFVGELGIWVAILTVFAFMMSDFFDTMGTMVGVGSQAGYLNERGELIDAQRPLLVDSLAAMAGGVVSSSSATTYIESSAGVAQGGRTGLVAIACGVLFLLAMPMAPLVEVVPTHATAPALIVVGWMMMSVLSEREDVTGDGRRVRTRGIDFTDIEIGLPVLATMMLMPLTYSITNGIGAGFVVWMALKLFRGKARQVNPALWVISLAFLVYFLRSFLGVAS
ncbi:MAG: NCS2 family permease [Chloroflexi bacterium]|nr:MAG: NCS2 family permease [Chloroflexota bacterium]